MESTEPEKIRMDDALTFNGVDGFVELPRFAFNNLPAGTVQIGINANRFNGELLYKETYHAATISCI
jgi:hypothetical protein